MSPQYWAPEADGIVGDEGLGPHHSVRMELKKVMAARKIWQATDWYGE
jgi:hypothetical protein